MFWCFGNKPRNYHCKIVLLDETEFIQEIQESSKGQQLLDVVNKHLNLMETAYFGLRFIDGSGQRHWLDPNKKIVKQVKGLDTFTFYFGVKFYSSDPCKLLEEITRYQFFLQVKQDIYQGRLPLTFDLAAELFAYSIQSELGDYDSRRHQTGYASEFRFTSNQSPDLESKAAEMHKGLCGRVPAVAELNFLDRIKWLDMYGVDLHPVLGEDNMEYFLGLTPSGVLVLRNKTKVGNYFWPRVSKVYFKGRYFMVRVRDKNNDENTFGFELANRQACKHLWKCCVDHHAFFKLTQVREVPGQSGKSYGLENKFSYGIRSDKNFQISTLQSKLRTPPTFVRLPSRRFQKRLGQPDGADAGTQAKEEDDREKNLENRLPLLPPHPVVVPSLHRSTSVPNALPRTTSASAPWEDPHFGSRGLYSNSTNPSPRSIRSAGALPSRRNYSHQRTGSIDSSASYDYRKRKHHQSRRLSDNESEVSKASRCSKTSRSSRTSHGHRRSGSQSGEGSDSESQHRHRRHSRRKKHGSTYEFVDSEDQWKEIQRQKQEQSLIRAQNAVVKDLSKRRSGYVNSGVETESETSYAQKRRHRKHRSRSRSPDSKTVLPKDVKRYIEYSLIESTGLTEQEKRDIKYTKVQSDSRLFKIRYSPVSNRSQMSKMASRSSINGNLHKMQGEEEDPPPPYTSNEQNGFLSPKQLADNDVDHEEAITVPTQIPKINLSSISQNGCIPRVTPKFDNDGPVVSVPNSTNHWMVNSRSSSSLNRSHVKSDVVMNGGMQHIKQDIQTYQPEQLPKNIRLVNGHFYPAAEKPQASTVAPHRVTFCNENMAYQYPQGYSSSRSWNQNTPRQNGEVPKSSEVQDSQNTHEMSTEL